MTVGAWISPERLRDDVWVLSEDLGGRVNAFLVVGNEAAVLVDTGTGYGEMLRTVAGLTDMPVHVILTHAHWERVGGAAEFTDVACSREEWEVESLAWPWRHEDVDPGHAERPAPGGSFPGVEPSRLLADGEEVTVGDLRVRAIATPGHTPGGQCLVFPDLGLVATGDTVHDGRLEAQLPESDPVLFARSLRRLADQLSGDEVLLCGRGAPLGDLALLERAIAAFAQSGSPDVVLADHARTPYVDALHRYADENPARFVVPGHKGGRAAAPQLRGLVGDEGLRLDIPLYTSGIDKGGARTSPFDEARSLAAKAWQARETFFVVGGATQANHLACVAIGQLARTSQPRVLVQRNVHQSVVNGLAIAGADVTWVEGQFDPELRIQHGLGVDVVETALREARDAQRPIDALIVVSPTYFGGVADVQGLREVTARHGTLLVIDEAWGAHFPFSERLPTTAVQHGADLVTTSTHKILGSLTQSALLHVGHHAPRETVAAVKKAVAMLKTTSPSSLLYGSLDAARSYAMTDGERLFAGAIETASRLREGVRQLDPRLLVIDESIVGPRFGVAAFDPLRVTVGTRPLGLKGDAVRDAMMTAGRRVEVELANADLFVALVGIGDSDGEQVEPFLAALDEALRTTPRSSHTDVVMKGLPRCICSLREGLFSTPETVLLEQAVGRVAAEVIAPYPPGIPIVMPGEEFAAETVELLASNRSAVEFPDAHDRHLRTVQVVAAPGAGASRLG